MKKQLITLTITALLAFLIGRASVTQTSHEVVYNKGKEASGNANISLPTREIQPLEPLLPYRYIFINNIQTEVVDTAQIINEYMAERTYSLTLFDNLHGRLDISPIVQYNKLTAMPFTYVPIEKTVFTQPKWTFFATASYNTFNIAGIGAGIFYKNSGVHYRYLWHTRLRENGHELGMNIKF